MLQIIVVGSAIAAALAFLVWRLSGGFGRRPSPGCSCGGQGGCAKESCAGGKELP